MQEIIEPSSGHLRRNDSCEHECGVKLWADDSSIIGDAGQYYAGAAAGVHGKGQIHQIEPTEACKTSCQCHGNDFDDTTSYKESDNHPKRKPANQIKLQSDNCKIYRNKKTKRNFPNGIERIGKESPLLMHHGEAGKKCSEYEADIERSSDHAIR